MWVNIENWQTVNFFKTLFKTGLSVLLVVQIKHETWKISFVKWSNFSDKN
jgi:hypothetical protein